MEGVVGGVSEGRVWGTDLLIFVTVGHAIQGFDRLMRAIDEMTQAGTLQGEIVVQHGHTGVAPRGCAVVDFLSRDEFERHVGSALVVITHGGAGSVGKCLQAGKKPVVVPRRRAFGEHVNDHQIELVRELDTRGRIYAAYDIAALPAAVTKALERGGTQPPSTEITAVATLVGKFIDQLSGMQDPKP